MGEWAPDVAFCELGEHVVFPDEEEGVALAHGAWGFAEADGFSSEGCKVLADKKVGVVYGKEDVLEVPAGFRGDGDMLDLKVAEFGADSSAILEVFIG